LVTIKLAAWNVEMRLSNKTLKHHGDSSQIINMIRRIGADVMVLPEAHGELSLQDLKSRDCLISAIESIA
jgi:hypothetical protein